MKNCDTYNRNSDCSCLLNCEGVFIYPNYGTASNPETVLANNRYEPMNPFAGFTVKCIAEIFYNNQWCELSGFEQERLVYGVVAVQLLPVDKIIVLTGDEALNLLDDCDSLPCRIYVEKGAKLP